MRAAFKAGGALAALVVLSVMRAFGAEAPASDALLPPGWVLEQTYRPGPGAPVGRVMSVTGQVIIVHADGPQGYPAAVNCALYEKDLLVTREEGRAVLELNDGSTVTLSAVTRLVIDRSVYDPAAGERESLVGMSVGKARFWVRKIAGIRRASFSVTTGTAVAGVRGSDFVILATDAQSVVTALENTRVEVSGLGLPSQAVVLADFQRTVVEAGQAPTAPEIVSAEEIKALMEELPLSAAEVPPAGTVVAAPPAGEPEAAGGSAAGRAGGAVIGGSVVNRAVGRNVANVAAGQKAAANLGAVRIDSSRVGGAVVNQAEAQDVDNAAVGAQSEANVGSVVVE